MQSLLAFYAVARFGSTVRAADYLNVTPSAVSHQLRKIETLLEVKLFQQNGRRIELTSAGNRYAANIGEALELIAESPSELDEVEPQGKLTISCSGGIGSFWFSRRIGLFANQFPRVSIKLITPQDDQDVYRSNVDFSIVYGNGNWKGMVVHLLYSPTFFPVCSPSLIENMDMITRPNDLAGFRLLHHVDHTDWITWLATAKAERVDAGCGIVFDDINHSFSAAIAGHGIAMADNVLAQDLLRDGSLIRLFSDEVQSSKSYYLVIGEESQKNPVSAACVSWILSEIGKRKIDRLIDTEA